MAQNIQVKGVSKNLIIGLGAAVSVGWLWYWWPQRQQLPAQPVTHGDRWKVLRVSDGDTVALRSEKGVEARVRFCGIDAPEVKHGDKPEQPLGRQSRDRLRELIDRGGGWVEMIPVESDRYGRTVAELFVVPLSPRQPEEEIFLNAQLVQEGLAYHYARYSGNCPNREAIAKAEGIARDRKLGVWALSGGGERPWDYRKRYR